MFVYPNLNIDQHHQVKVDSDLLPGLDTCAGEVIRYLECLHGKDPISDIFFNISVKDVLHPNLTIHCKSLTGLLLVREKLGNFLISQSEGKI